MSDSDFCNVLFFQCEGTFFYEECTRKSCFSVALHPSSAVALPSYHVRRTLSSLAFFLPIFTSWQEGVLILASWPGIYLSADLPTFQAFKGGQTEKVKIRGCRDFLRSSHRRPSNRGSVLYPIIMMLVRIRGLVVFQIWTLSVLFVCGWYKVYHGGVDRQCNDKVLIFSGY